MSERELYRTSENKNTPEVIDRPSLDSSIVSGSKQVQNLTEIVNAKLMSWRPEKIYVSTRTLARG